jgi:apolipoprotein N-acyltransferase
MPGRPILKPFIAIGRFVLAVGAAAGGAWLGFRYGDAVGYALADLVDRDPAELKDTLIWGTITSAAFLALAGAWLALTLTRAARRARFATLIALAVATLGGAGMMAAAYDWPKSAGTPVIDYELRLPPGTTLPPNQNDIRMFVWSDQSGQGVHIKEVRRTGPRPEIIGTLVLPETEAPTMSIQLPGGPERHWRLPFTSGAKLDAAFGPRQGLEFVTPLGRQPIPADSDYDIRYRVRRYM